MQRLYFSNIIKCPAHIVTVESQDGIGVKTPVNNLSLPAWWDRWRGGRGSDQALYLSLSQSSSSPTPGTGGYRSLGLEMSEHKPSVHLSAAEKLRIEGLEMKESKPSVHLSEELLSGTEERSGQKA